MQNIIKSLCTAGAIVLLLGTCSEPFNPSFNDMLHYSDEELKEKVTSGGTGTFEWDISFPKDKVDPSISYLELAKTPSGDDILGISKSWLNNPENTDSQSRVAGSRADLPVGSYFLRFRLANKDSYVIIAKIVTIDRDKSAKFAQTINANKFKPFVLIEANLNVTSGAPVNTVQATLEFYAGYHPESNEPFEKLCRPDWEEETRSINLTELDHLYHTTGWLAVPVDSDSVESALKAAFWVKITVTDDKGRDFIRVHGPYHIENHWVSEEARSVSIELGTENDGSGETKGNGSFYGEIKLLHAVQVAPSSGGRLWFSSDGSDGKEYGTEWGYAGVEPAYNIYIFNETEPEYALRIIECHSTSNTNCTEDVIANNPYGGDTKNEFPELADNNKLEEDSSDKGKFFKFRMPKMTGRGDTPIIIAANFIHEPYAARLQTPSSYPKNWRISFQMFDYLAEAVQAASLGEGRQIITVIKNLNTGNNINDMSKFINPASGIVITIPSGCTIDIGPDNNKQLVIERAETSDVSTLFKVEGTLVLSAGGASTFTIDGKSKEGLFFDVTENGQLDIGAGNVLKNSQSSAVSVSNGMFNLTGGELSSNMTAVYVMGGGTFNMSSGNIAASANLNATGVTINNNGTFNMSGGTVTSKTSNGNAVVVNGTFKMSGEAYISDISGNPGIVKLGTTSNTIDVSGELGKPIAAVIEPAGRREDFAVLSGTKVLEHYGKFKITDDKDTANVSRPWTLTSEAKLYAPEARLYKNGESAYTYKLRLPEAFTEAAGTGQNPDKIALLRDIAIDSIGISAGKHIMMVPEHHYVSQSYSTEFPFPLTDTKTLKRKSTLGELFNVSSNASFSLSGTSGTGADSSIKLILDGDNISVNAPLVKIVNGGTFTLNAQAILKNNNSLSDGGGVDNSGTFKMIGGEISNNKAAGGGGVRNSGTFEMTGGKISENTVSTGYGKGVYNDGTFSINNDAIIVSGIGGSQDVFLVKGKFITVGNAFNHPAGTKAVYITPEGLITEPRQVLGGENISNGKQYFSVNRPSGQTSAGSNTWMIDNNGKLFMDFDVSCSLPQNPNSALKFVLPVNGIVKKRGETVEINFVDFTPAVNNCKARIDGTTADLTSSYTGAKSTVTIPTVSYGQHTITVFITKEGLTYSGDFQIIIQQ